jgi:hypothetical protein
VSCRVTPARLPPIRVRSSTATKHIAKLVHCSYGKESMSCMYHASCARLWGLKHSAARRSEVYKFAANDTF